MSEEIPVKRTYYSKGFATKELAQAALDGVREQLGWEAFIDIEAFHIPTAFEAQEIDGVEMQIPTAWQWYFNVYNTKLDVSLEQADWMIDIDPVTPYRVAL
jgi:hypothetical protein